MEFLLFCLYCIKSNTMHQMKTIIKIKLDIFLTKWYTDGAKENERQERGTKRWHILSSGLVLKEKNG